MDDTTRNIDPDQAQEMLAQVELVQSQVRRSLLSSNWWLFILWGAISLGSVYPVLFSDDLGFYWVVAAPLGAIASYAIGYRMSHDVGTTLSSWPYVVTGVALFVGTFGSSWVLEGVAAVTGVWVAVGLGFSVFAVLDRQFGAVAVFAVLIGLSFVFAWRLDDVWTVYMLNGMSYGMAFLSLGLGLRVGGWRPAGISRRR